MPIPCLARRSCFELSVVISSSSITIRPDDGSSNRLSSLTNVLFPAPLYPITPNISPSGIVRVKSSTAAMSSLFSLKTLRKPSIEITLCPPLRSNFCAYKQILYCMNAAIHFLTKKQKTSSVREQKDVISLKSLTFSHLSKFTLQELAPFKRLKVAAVSKGQSLHRSR